MSTSEDSTHSTDEIMSCPTLSTKTSFIASYSRIHIVPLYGIPDMTHIICNKETCFSSKRKKNYNERASEFIVSEECHRILTDYVSNLYLNENSEESSGLPVGSKDTALCKWTI